MALTREFKETVRARVQRDAAFGKELLRDGVEGFLDGDVEAGKGDSAGLHQRHHRLSGAGRTHQPFSEEFDEDAGAVGESERTKFV